MATLHRSLLLATAAALAACSSSGAPLRFDFADPKGVNNAQFRLDAPLESISGQGTGISGTVVFDPAAPAGTTGRIALAAASLTVGNSTMQEHLHGPAWLDVAKYPEITFEARSFAAAMTEGPTTRAEVSGVLTIKGIAKTLTVPVSLTHLPDKLGARLGKPEAKGDLLVLRATFAINRSDFDINPGKYADKVAERIELTLSLAGAAPTGVK